AAGISRLAVGDPSIGRTSVDYPIHPATVQTERESADLPVGSRGGIAIRHEFPLDAEYVIKVRLQRGKDATTIVGNSEQRELDIRVEAAGMCFFRFKPPDDAVEVRVAVKAGPHTVAEIFLKTTVNPEGTGVLAGTRPFSEGAATFPFAAR